MTEEPIFGDLIGHSAPKALLREALRAGNVHLLLEGEPASGKTVALTAIEDALPHVVYQDAAGLSERELRDILAADPMVLLLDEIDAAQPDVYNALPTAMEQGRVTKGVAGDRKDTDVETQVFAACNWANDLPKHLLSRFRIVPFQEYNRDEYLSVTTELLRSNVEWVESDEAARSVAREVNETLETLNPRDARDVALMAGTLDRVVDIARAMADPTADVDSEPVTADEVIERRGAQQRQRETDRIAARPTRDETREQWSIRSCEHLHSDLAYLSGRYLCGPCQMKYDADATTPLPEARAHGPAD